MRTILGIVCIILAIAVMFGVAPIFNKVSSEKLDIIRIKKDVNQGHQITAEDVTVVTVGGYNLPASVIKDTKDVIGKYAACDLKSEDYILPSKIKVSADNSNDVFRMLNGNEQAMSITLSSFAGGLSGKLQNGDIVSILVSTSGESKITTIPNELQYVKVITTTTPSGNDKDELLKKEDGSYELPSTVTLLVNSAQAKLLAQYESNGKIHIALVYRGDDVTANKFLETQKEVLTN